jgi:hypothetical protein
MLVIRILGLQAALVAAQLLNLPDIPVVGDVVGGLLGGGGGTTTPDVVAVPNPGVTSEPSTPVVDEPEVVVIPETVPAPVEATPTPEPQAPETPTPEPTVVVPPVVVVPTPEPAPVVPQQQPPVDSPAAPAPAAPATGGPAAVFVPPAQQQPAAAPPAAAASPSTGAGAGGVILASPSAASVAPAPNPATTPSPGMSVFVPPGVAAAVNVGTTSLDVNGVPIPTAGPSPDGSVAQDIPAAPNTNTDANPDLSNGQVTQEEQGGGMPMGTKIAVGVAGGAGGVMVLVVVLYVFWKRRMRRSAWRKKLEGPGSGEAKFNVAGSTSGSSEGGKVEWVETRGHDVTFDFGFEKEEARIAHGRGASASGFSAKSGMEKDVEAGYRVELEGDSPPVSRGR